MYVHMYVWPEDIFRCCFSGAIHLVFGHQVSHWPGIHNWARLTGQWTLGFYLSPQCWDYKCASSHLCFFMGSVEQLRSSCLPGEHFPDWEGTPIVFLLRLFLLSTWIMGSTYTSHLSFRFETNPLKETKICFRCLRVHSCQKLLWSVRQCWWRKQGLVVPELMKTMVCAVINCGFLEILEMGAYS